MTLKSLWRHNRLHANTQVNHKRKGLKRFIKLCITITLVKNNNHIT